MEYTNEVKEYVSSKFNEALDLFGYKKNNILYKLSLCNEEERFLMEYLYASMPLSDISNYDFDLFLKYVKQGIFISENTPWGLKIPEDIFLNYVLHYRVNNEAIEDCRDVFYQMLKDRVEGKSMYEAALEVNYWCAEKATYKSTDERTASPLTVLKCGYGRCGEESTFLVTALRSVGIPARQIYTPRWAHCDDNHAWVEVWCDGKWHYLGACEPEPVLDKGWFTSAASRAMVIHSRIFSNYIKSEEIISQNNVLTTISNIEKYAPTKRVHIKVINSQKQPIEGAEIRVEILNYSEFATVAKLFTDSQGQAFISLGLGTVSFHVVKGGKFLNKIIDLKDVKVIEFNMDEAMSYEEEVLGQDIDMIPPKDRKILPYSITEEEQAVHNERVKYCNAVREESINKILREIEDRKSQLLESKALSKLKDEEVVRKDKGQAIFEDEGQAIESQRVSCIKYANSTLKEVKQPIGTRENALLKVVQASFHDINNILFKSSGNYNEILNFLKVSTDYEDLEKRVDLLKTLSNKDYVDSKSNILDSHINNVVSFSKDYPKEIYLKYVLCPRIYLEKITAFREEINNYFSEDLKESFKEEPVLIWSYINENVKEFQQHEYEELYTLPLETLKMGSGSLISKKILFVAICRTLGIPARINPNDLYVEYYKYNAMYLSGMNKIEKTIDRKQGYNTDLLGTEKDVEDKLLRVRDKHENHNSPSLTCNCNIGFVKVEDVNTLGNSMLTVNNISDSELKYYQNWTIAVLDKGVYRTLSLQDNIPPQGKAYISLVPGNYRILTSNRLPNGSIFSKKYMFSVSAKENKEIEIAIRDAKISDMLENYELQDFMLKDKSNDTIYASQLMKEDKSIIIWIEEGKEPTEHILNEIIDLSQDFANIPGGLIFVLKDISALQNKTLQKVYELVPNIKTYFDDFSYNVNTIARRMYLDPDKLPLILVANKWNHPWGDSIKCNHPRGGDNLWNSVNGIYACSGYNVGVGELLIKIVRSL